MQFLPCLLCAAKLERRTDKNGKPYFVCNPCGIQFFIRRQHGIDLLQKLLRDCEKNEIPYRQRAQEIYVIQSLLTGITETKKQIDRVKSQITLLFPDKDKVRACNLLKIKLESLFVQLNKIAQQRN
jgi:hypothetical protein